MRDYPAQLRCKNGAVRDVTGIQQIPGFQVYTRGVDPSALENVMLTGINVPIRMGDVTVMPGDVAIGDPDECNRYR